MVLALMLALAASPVADVANLQFHSAFRPNLHHTLHAAGTPGGRPLDSPVKTSLTGSMTDAERRGWEAAVAYYAREISPKGYLIKDLAISIHTFLDVFHEEFEFHIFEKEVDIFQLGNNILVCNDCSILIQVVFHLNFGIAKNFRVAFCNDHVLITCRSRIAPQCIQ